MLKTDNIGQATQRYIFVPVGLSVSSQQRQTCNISHTLPLLLQIYGQLTTFHVSLSKHYVYVMIYEEINEKQGPHHRTGRFLRCQSSIRCKKEKGRDNRHKLF